MGRDAYSLRRWVIRVQDLLRRHLHIEVHRHYPPAPPCNVLAVVISDVVLRRVLAGDDTRLTFLQVGANDGVTNDPIHAFVTRFGFRGVCVEPQPEAFARLRQTYRDRPEVVCVNAALSSTDGTMPLFRFRAGPGIPPEADGLASFSREALVANFQGLRGEIETLSIPTMSAASLLAMHPMQHVDLLQVDTEGFDFEILKLLLPCVRPTIIHFEAQFLLPQERHACESYLVGLGYTVTPNGPDSVAYLQPAEQTLVLTKAMQAGTHVHPIRGNPEA